MPGVEHFQEEWKQELYMFKYRSSLGKYERIRRWRKKKTQKSRKWEGQARQSLLRRNPEPVQRQKSLRDLGPSGTGTIGKSLQKAIGKEELIGN